MLDGIAPILFTPFDENGDIDAHSLRKILRFELDGGVHAIGINGFASEAYKMTDDERRENVEIVTSELARAVPLIIGIAPNSTEAAISQARQLAPYRPAALMTLPPADDGQWRSILCRILRGLRQGQRHPDHPPASATYTTVSSHRIAAEALAEIADRAPNVKYFKLEGPGSAAKMKALAPLLGGETRMFGGGGGITVLDELRSGAAGLIPGVGFNEIFLAAWGAWKQSDADATEAVIKKGEALTKAVSGRGP